MEKIKIFGELATKNFIIFNDINEEILFIHEVKINIKPKLKTIMCDITFHHPTGFKIEPKTYEVVELNLTNRGF